MIIGLRRVFFASGPGEQSRLLRGSGLPATARGLRQPEDSLFSCQGLTRSSDWRFDDKVVGKMLTKLSY